MANRSERAGIAAETVAVIHAGEYVAPSGRKVEIVDAVRDAIDRTVLVTPADAPSLSKQANQKLAGVERGTTFEVRNEGTFTAARRLVEQYGPERVAALNFASAKNPGGGYLGGSQAQEESLSRASALVACLERQPCYYDANRHSRSLLYTDHLILSPRVPVFRDEDDRLLETPWAVTIITSPAPNRGALAKNEPDRLNEVVPTFRRRIEQVLAAAVVHDQTVLVLGAWGCGVFGNDPAIVAELFGEFLLVDGLFSRAFDHVAFAVLDRKGETIAPFEATFAGAQRT
jgi:uncharacterized protein (TIGR02452 family)